MGAPRKKFRLRRKALPQTDCIVAEDTAFGAGQMPAAPAKPKEIGRVIVAADRASP